MTRKHIRPSSKSYDIVRIHTTICIPLSDTCRYSVHTYTYVERERSYVPCHRCSIDTKPSYREIHVPLHAFRSIWAAHIHPYIPRYMCVYTYVYFISVRVYVYIHTLIHAQIYIYIGGEIFRRALMSSFLPEARSCKRFSTRGMRQT